VQVLLVARLAFFTRLTRLALDAFFTRRLCVIDDLIEGRTQFTLALFAWLTLLARCAFAAGLWLGVVRFELLTWLALFALTRLTLLARGTLLTWLAFGARCAFFPRLALLVASASGIAAAVLLAAAAAFVVTRRAAAAGGLLLDFRGGCFRLSGEQADERLDQALEQAGFLRGRCCAAGSGRGSRGRCGALWRGLHGRFLAYQRAGRGSRLNVFGFGMAHLVAGLAGHDFRAVVTQALHFEVRGF